MCSELSVGLDLEALQVQSLERLRDLACAAFRSKDGGENSTEPPLRRPWAEWRSRGRQRTAWD